jgi:hypothetical protein
MHKKLCINAQNAQKTVHEKMKIVECTENCAIICWAKDGLIDISGS